MSRIKYDYDFVCGVFIDGELQFNKIRIDLGIYINSSSQTTQGIAFERITYFLQDVIQKSVFIDETDEKTIKLFENANIPILTVPSPGPYDQLLQGIIVTKLNSMLCANLIVVKSSIQSTLGSFITYIYGINSEEAIDDIIDFDDHLKWWNDPEPRFTDLNEEDPVDFRAVNSWKEYNLEWDADEDIFDGEFEDDDGKIIDVNDNIVNLSDFKDD